MPKRKISSTNNRNREKLMSVCGSMYAFNLLAGRWKLKIIYMLAKKNMRFSEIKEQVSIVTDRMLTLHLKELEQDDLIERKLIDGRPPKVEYRLTQIAENLSPILQTLEDWGNLHREKRIKIEQPV
jgi:DNA-binding HxlR family transcriptional regulator